MPQGNLPSRYWLMATVPCLPESQDAVSALVFREGAKGCEEQEGQLIAYFEIQDEFQLQKRLQTGCAKIRAAGLPLPDVQVTVSRLQEEDWHAGWRAYFTPIPIGDTLIIRPSWERIPNASAKVEVIIEPKQAFGTGNHATTRLMLKAIADRADVLPLSALDVGTGSGVLAITHVLLAPTSQVVACDIDPLAIANAAENAYRNGVRERIHFLVGSLEAMRQITYPLIYANLQRSIILSLLPELIQRLEKRGHLLLGGILAAEEKILQEAIASLPLQIIRVHSLEQWMLLEVMHIRGS